MEANNAFWEVTLEIYSEDDKGKIKKTKEVHLVDAANPTEVESKVKSEMDGTMEDYKIKSIKCSSVFVVY